MRDWLRTGLTAGQRVRRAGSGWRGDLAQFPFADGKGGTFPVTGKARGVRLDYAPGWPPMSELDGEVDLDGTRLAIDAARGRVADAPLGAIHAEIGDLRAESPLLVIDGEAAGPTVDFLRFIDASPVAGWIGHATEGAQVSGDGRLDLKISIPLGKPGGNTVAGEFRFIDNELRLPACRGCRRSTARWRSPSPACARRALAVKCWAARRSSRSPPTTGGTRVTGTGTATAAALRREFDPPYGDALSGTLDWNLRPRDDGGGLDVDGARAA